MNEITKKQVPFSVAIRSDAYKNMINGTLQDPKIAQKFVADITSVVANNPTLKNCDAGSIIAGGLMAQSLQLSLSQSLGYCYLVPYKDKAQFLVGFKGLIQLAQRTGQYRRLGVRVVHKGEYLGQDEFGDDTFKFSHDYDNEEVIGYYAYFELLNGFRKTLYMTKEQCEKHATKYSSSYKYKKGNSLWETDFDTMAQKTVLKQLLSKWGVMSIELQEAVKSDQAVIHDKDNLEYVDNEPEEQTSNVADTLDEISEEETEAMEKYING